ncbi:MAG: ankyrin repeat domain-containing protein [Vulcanimicrobiota bacterium]
MKRLIVLLAILGFFFCASGVANAVPDMQVRAYIIAVNNSDNAKIDSLLTDNPQLVDVPDDVGLTELMRAVDFGKMSTVELIVSKNADLNLQNPVGKTALIYAAKNGSLELVKFLVSKGANMNIKDNRGLRAVTWAVNRNDNAGNEIADYLRGYGAKE